MGFNAQAAQRFERMAQMLELTGANRFRVNAHERAARVLKDHTGDLEPSAKGGDAGSLMEIDGIGEGTAEKLIELAQRGAISEHDELASKVPGGLMDILEIQGLGPKTVKLMWDEKGVESIEDLKRILEDGSIADLPRMGAKTMENIKESIAFMESSGDASAHRGRPTDRRQVVERMSSVGGVERVACAGSLRRGKETIGDIDLLVVARDPGAARDAFVGGEGVTKVLASGETKSSIRCAINPATIAGAGATTPRRRSRSICASSTTTRGAPRSCTSRAPKSTMSACASARSPGHDAQRVRALRGRRVRGHPAPAARARARRRRTEEAIYTALGLPWIPPTLREDRGELELTETPDLITVEDIVSDLHTHTTDSDGKLIARGVRGDREGARLPHPRDHGPFPVVQGRGRALARASARADRDDQGLQQGFEGVEILCGSEVDIRVDGSLDYDDDLLAALDVVVASPHAGLKAKPKDATKRLIRAIEHPLVHIIGHPTGRLIERRPGLEPDMDEVIAAAVEHNVALEVNSHWMRLDLRDTHVRAAVEKGCAIAIDCDVHTAGDYDNIRFGVMTAQRGWLTKDRCVNAWSRTALRAWLDAKR